MLGGHQHVAFAQEVEGPAAGHAVDGPDHRLPEVIGLGPEPVARVVVHEVVGRPIQGGGVVQRSERLVAVDAGTERLIAGPGKNYYSDVVVGPDRLPQGLAVTLHAGGEGVVGLGPVKHHGGHVVVDRHQQRVEGVWGLVPLTHVPETSAGPVRPRSQSVGTVPAHDGFTSGCRSGTGLSSIRL